MIRPGVCLPDQRPRFATRFDDSFCFRWKNELVNHLDIDPGGSNVLRIPGQDGASVLRIRNRIFGRRTRSVVVVDESEEIWSDRSVLHEEFVLEQQRKRER